MQIHELDNYSGSLDSGAYVAVDNGSDTGKVSATTLFADVNQDIEELDTSLNARIDNIIAGGSAPSEAEIIDARLGAAALGSVAYTSLGAAVRGQATLLKDYMNHISDSTNLFDSAEATDDMRLTESGNAQAAAGYYVSDYISVEEGYYYYKNSPTTDAFHRLAIYDSNKTFISAQIYTANYVLIPNNGAYIRICGLMTEKSTTVINRITAIDEQGRKALTATNAEVSDIKNVIDETTNKSPNLHNALTDHEGYYFSGGSYLENINYNATAKIPVEIGETYYFSNDGLPITARTIGFYSPSDNYLIGSDVSYVDSITIPAGVGSMIVSFGSTYDKVQIESGAISKYFPYDYIYVDGDRVDGLDLVSNKVKRSSHAINNGSSYPTSLRTGYKTIYVGDIEGAFNGFYINRGTESMEQVVVGSTILRYICAGEESNTNHGLTWKDKCIVIIDSIDLAHTKVTLITNGGEFSYTFDRPKGYGNNGEWSTQYDTMNGTLIQQIAKPNDIWILGDSYMSYADDRIGGALYEMGQEAPTILSIPGAKTSLMAAQFANMIDCYNVVPSVVCVCTGINDDNASEYQTGLDKIIQYAEKNGIKIITTAIPITPSRLSQNLAVRNYVLTLDYETIRFDEAVGSSDLGVWYDNCLNADNVHPTQNGARLMAGELINTIGYLCN